MSMSVFQTRPVHRLGLASLLLAVLAVFGLACASASVDGVDVSISYKPPSDTHSLVFETSEHVEILQAIYTTDSDQDRCNSQYFPAMHKTVEAPPRGVVFDSDDIGTYYCLRVSFSSPNGGGVEFIGHHLQPADLRVPDAK